MENIRNKLIGIPFKLNRRDFKGCDCIGIVWLYHKYILGNDLPFSDGQRVFFRDKKRDIIRMVNGLNKIATRIQFKDLIEGDIVILKSLKFIGALGVCMDNGKLLHMDMRIGSCLTGLEKMQNLFLFAYRINNE